MSQPTWKYLKNIGDANPLDHGGLFVFEDETGIYPPEMERVDPVSDEDGADVTIHRVVLEPCTYIDGVLSDNKFHLEIPAWFADSIGSVATASDVEPPTLIRHLCSDDVIARAIAYRDIFDYHGWDNGDAYPRTISYKEAQKRYRKILEEGT